MPALRPSLLAILASAALFSTICPAQGTAPCTPGVQTYPGLPVVRILSEPYSATQAITLDRRTADGNTIHGVARLFNARDSTGRTRMETSMGCLRDKSGQLYQRIAVRVTDPQAGTCLDWEIGGPAPRVAHLLHRPQASSIMRTDRVLKDSVTSVNVPGRGPELVRLEVLGTKYIGNILVEGLRTTEGRPPGQSGNAEPIIVTRVEWLARQMGLTMSFVDDTPSRGHTEITLEDLTLAEPDPSLFAPPPGYKIIEQPQPGTVTPTN